MAGRKVFELRKLVVESGEVLWCLALAATCCIESRLAAHYTLMQLCSLEDLVKRRAVERGLVTVGARPFLPPLSTPWKLAILHHLELQHSLFHARHSKLEAKRYDGVCPYRKGREVLPCTRFLEANAMDVVGRADLACIRLQRVVRYTNSIGSSTQ